MGKPLVSICIPTYNGERYLPEALGSILGQTYSPIELIISDDNSRDNTLSIVNEYISKVPFPATLLKHEPSSIGTNWNNCVKHANGDYIKFLFQDDILENHCIETMMEDFLKEPENTGLVYCKKKLIGSFVESQQKLADMTFSTYHSMTGMEILSSPMLFKHPRNKIGEPTCCLIKRNVFNELGFFNERLMQSLDYEFWYRLIRKFEIKAIDSRLVRFRIHDRQASIINSRKIIPDSYLLPFLLLKNHTKHLHSFTVMVLLIKFISGLARYLLLKTVLYQKKIKTD
jgi:glycosyltransferase involved in cell wall biosynthesis